MINLTHITDVGSPAGNGVDSTERIRKQYERLDVSPRIVTAGQSPLRVAFTACTDVAPQARENARKILARLGKTPKPLAPTALNSAPRNFARSRSNGKEDYIFRVKHDGVDQETLLIYGPEVLQWILAFRGRIGATVEKIIEIPDIIPDTSTGSQFRSAEHLPLVHYLESEGLLDENSKRQSVEIDSIPDISPNGKTVVLPPDEYANGRLLANRELFNDILDRDKVHSDTGELAIKKSLTEIDQGTLTVWPSSNHFPGDHFGVLNIGTRWEEGTTKTTNDNVIRLSEKLSHEVGKNYGVEI
mgnify:CR=1 FL=1